MHQAERKYNCKGFAVSPPGQRITPVDYDPPIYVVNILKKHYPGLSPRFMALGKLPGISVYENTGEAGEMTIIASPCENIPPHVKRIDHLNVEVWIDSFSLKPSSINSDSKCPSRCGKNVVRPSLSRNSFS